MMCVVPYCVVCSNVESPRSRASCKDFAGGGGVITIVFSVVIVVVKPPFGEICDALKSSLKLTFLLIS